MNSYMLVVLALALPITLAAQSVEPGTQVRIRNKGFCLDQAAGFRCFKGGTRGTVEEVTPQSIMVRLHRDDQLVSWDPGRRDVELSVLTGHHSRSRRALVGFGIGGASGIAFGLLAPSVICLFCSESELHSVQRAAAVGFGVALGTFGALVGLALPTSIWTPLHWIPTTIRPVVTGFGGSTRLGLSFRF